MDESFALACRLTGAKIVRGTKQRRARVRGSTKKNAGKLHHEKSSIRGKNFLIFTAGNPPEGQQ
jgi:hypothetical protein